MKCLLLALGLALVCGTQAVHIPYKGKDLDIRNVAGTWHSVAMAASDISLLDAESGPLRVNVEELKPTPEGDLEIIWQKWENHKCVEETIVAQKTEDPAVFTVDYHGDRKISVLSTDYTKYMIFCTVASTPAAEHGTLCQCLARTLEVDNAVMEKCNSGLESLPQQLRVILDLSQGKEQCHI